jgi:4-carboxymuconolactone decarboxylase
MQTASAGFTMDLTRFHHERSPRDSSPAGVQVTSSHARGQEGGSALDYTETLRSLAINDAQFADGVAAAESKELDPKTFALVRLAALVAVGGAVPSYGAEVDAAVSAGATAAEIVDVLVGIIPIVGLPTAVTAAPRLAMALGYDTDDAFESQSGG